MMKEFEAVMGELLEFIDHEPTDGKQIIAEADKQRAYRASTSTTWRSSTSTRRRSGTAPSSTNSPPASAHHRGEAD